MSVWIVVVCHPIEVAQVKFAGKEMGQTTIVCSYKMHSDYLQRELSFTITTENCAPLLLRHHIIPLRCLSLRSNYKFIVVVSTNGTKIQTKRGTEERRHENDIDARM